MPRATTPGTPASAGVFVLFEKVLKVLLSYIDEIGSTGAFIHPKHKRYADSPAFGYGGFVIPADNARELGAFFANKKREFLKSEIPSGADPGRWEKKGADLLYARVAEERPQNLKLLAGIITQLSHLGGHLLYFAEEKPVGSPKKTNTGKLSFKNVKPKRCKKLSIALPAMPTISNQTFW